MVEKRFTVKAVVSLRFSKQIQLVLIPVEIIVGALHPGAVPSMEKVMGGSGKTEEEQMIKRMMKVAMSELDQRMRQYIPPSRQEPIHPDTVLVKLTIEEYEKMGKPVPLDVVVLSLKVEAEPPG